MKFNLKQLRPLRALFTLCLTVLMVLSFVAPTLAAPMRNEPNPAANAAAKKYEQAAREALEGGPGPSMKESQKLTNNGGLNEVQGTAAVEDMKRPSNSGGVPTVEKEIKNALEKVQNKID